VPRSNGLERWRGEVTATLKDITGRIDGLGERFEKALTQHTSEDHEAFAAVDTNLSEAKKRIGDLEAAQSNLLGKIAVLSVLGGAFAAALAQGVLKGLFG
jgi:hypothetical protein